jgi:hypothetical protein
MASIMAIIINIINNNNGVIINVNNNNVNNGINVNNININNGNINNGVISIIINNVSIIMAIIIKYQYQ